MSTAPRRLPIALLVMALAALLGPRPAAAEEYGILQTHNTRGGWHARSATGPTDPVQLVTDAIAEARKEFPDDLAIDMGAFADPVSASETAFDSVSARVYYEQGFAAVNMTPRDFVYFAGNEMGAKRRPAEQKDLFLSAFDVPNMSVRAMPLPAMKVVEHGGRTFALATVAVEDALALFPRWTESRITPPGEEVIAQAMAAGADKVIVLSSRPRAANLLLAEQFPAIDLILETASGPGEATKAGNVHIVPAPAPNEFQRLLVREDGGAIASIDFERREWIPASLLAEFTRIPLPVIGVSVPPKGRVAERLRVPGETVNVEIHRSDAHRDLTTRDEIYVYRLALEGETLRVYRVRQYVESGFLPIDVLVVLDEQRRVRRVEANLLKWPIVSYDTNLGPLIMANLGKTLDEWTFDAPGIETVQENVDVLMDALRKTVELDRRLYGE